MALGEVIRELRVRKVMRQVDLARQCGLTQDYLAHLERGRFRLPRRAVLEALARALGVSMDYLLEASGYVSSTLPAPRPVGRVVSELIRSLETLEVVELPLRGSVPAGTPLPEEEQVLEYVPIPKALIEGVKNPYALRVSGDSLVGDGINQGDIVVVDPDAPVVDGKIYIVRLGNEVLARRIRRENNQVKLTASHGASMSVAGKAEILGRVVLAGNWKKH